MLLFGLLMVVFAPGATMNDRSAPPAVVAAAVLAPTTIDGSGATPAVPRDELAFSVLVLAVMTAFALLAAAATTRSMLASSASSPPSAPEVRQPRRRGPPLAA